MRKIPVLCLCALFVHSISLAEGTQQSDNNASQAATDQPALEQIKLKIDNVDSAITKATAAKDKDAALKDIKTAVDDLKKTQAAASENAKKLTPLLQNFSAGLAVIFISGEEHVDKYSVRGQPIVDANGQTISIGQTHVDRDKSNIVMPWLETHYIWDSAFSECQRKKKYHDVTRSRFCTTHTKPGFFVGVGLNPTTSALDTFGLGLLLSSKRTAWSLKDSDNDSINVGIGWYTTQITVLAKDTPEGKNLPQGYTSPATHDKTITGPMLNISFSI